MPYLSEISYSRDACITAFRDYYRFLSSMYLDEAYIIEPPEGGWSHITQGVLGDLGTTDEVIALLSHLPYIRSPNDDKDRAYGAPRFYFADWQDHSGNFIDGRTDAETMKVITEGVDYSDIPAHVVGLVVGGRDDPVVLLDTQLGVVYWDGCPTEIRRGKGPEGVLDDPHWRAGAVCWAIADFFETLKQQFRELKFIPVNSKEVIDIYSIRKREYDGMEPMLQRVYREHGWPSSDYCKRDCLKAVEAALNEKYPSYLGLEHFPEGVTGVEGYSV